MNRPMRALGVLATSAMLVALGGQAALADNTIVDSDSALPITESTTISFGNVCVGKQASSSRLVVASRNGNGNVWQSDATLTATATAKGGAVATVSDESIKLPSNWVSLDNNSLSGETAAVTLAVAPSSAADLSGTLLVTLTGAKVGGGSLARTATLNWTAKGVSCNTPPSITVNDVTLEGNTLGGRTLAFADVGTAGDAEDSVAPGVTCSPAIGQLLPLGATTVTCTATDSQGLTATDSGTVTIQDTTAPAITGTPSSVTLEATSAAGAIHTFASPSAHDIVWGSVPVACAPASGSTFPLGSTTVNCTATDGSGRASSTSFQVNVHDETAPVFDQPEDVTAEATSADGASVDFPTPSATDVVSGTIEGICSPASGEQFPLGYTPVKCTATDEAGNEGSTSFMVRVVDTTPPVLTVPSDITAEATSPLGAPVTYEPSATDAVDSTPIISCNPTSGSIFSLGSTTVSCTATDAEGNTSDPQTFKVTVKDTTAPVLQDVPASFELEGNTSGGAFGTYTPPTASDLVDPNPTVECDPADSSFFALGENTVTCTASDYSGNTFSQSFTITVVDTTKPVIQWASTTPAPNAAGWNNSDVTVKWDCTDIVGVMATTVTKVITAQGTNLSATGTCTDTSGNTASDVRSGIKIDKTPPTLSPSVSPNPVTLNEVAVASAGAGDALSGVATSSCGPVDTSAIGSKSVSCTATDYAGNVSSANATYGVVYSWNGFFRPVDNSTPTDIVYNTVKAGQAIPMKFSLSGNKGLSIFASGSPTSKSVACQANATQDAVEESLTVSNSGLSYDGSIDQYNYVWKSDRAWTGCRLFSMKLIDGTEHTAYFKFLK